MFRLLLVEDTGIFRESLSSSLQLKFPSMEIAEAAGRDGVVGKKLILYHQI